MPVRGGGPIGLRRSLNAAARTALDREPIPVEGGQRASSCIVYEAGVWRTAFVIEVRKEPYGPAYGSAREAATASRYVNRRGDA
jgi:hypothetical protein